MHAREWLQAHQSGAILHEWTELDLSYGSKVAKLKVSADAVRVQYPDGRLVRESAGAYALEQIAQSLGGHMLTAKLVETRHLHATRILKPLVSGLIKHGGTVANTTAEEHSAAIDRAVSGEEIVPFTGYGDAPSQGWPGDPVVSNLGKTFIIDEKCSSSRAVNHGWLVHSSVVSFSHGRPEWLGIPVYPAVWALSWYVIQRRGDAHGFGHTGADQDDYSQLAIIADGTTWIDGVGDVPTEKVYTDRDLAGLVTHDRQPLKWARHPNVPLILNGPESQPDTIKAITWQNPNLTHGQRAVEWMLAQLDAGVAEQPMGSNNGPGICDWLGACVRESQPGLGDYLRKAGGNWCAASACAATTLTRMEHDPPLPYLHRASGIEMQRDAINADAWRPAQMAASGEFELELGDVVILQSGKPGSWRRHVCRFLRWVDYDAKIIETIGGNEGNRFNLSTMHVTRPLGFIEMPSPTRPTVMVELPEDVIHGVSELVAHAEKHGDLLTDGLNASAMC